MTSREIKELLQPIFERYREEVLFAYLFGTAVDAEIHPLSDIDIAVFLSKAAASPLDLKLSLYADFCRVLKRNDIDVVVLNRADNLMLLDQIIRRGVLLLDGEKNLRDEFEARVLHRTLDFKMQRWANMGV